MAVGIDDYKKLKTKDMDRLFSELFQLKEEKAEIDKKIKAIESQYKPDIKDLKHNLYYELDNGLKFSIRVSKRAGGYDSKLVDKFFEDQGVMNDDYKKPETSIQTLRLDQ